VANFVAYLDERGIETITINDAVAWATLPSGCGQRYCWYRLYSVRGFARYLHARDPRHEVPPSDLLPIGRHRATPYLYSDEEIAALIAAAGRLSHPLRALTLKTAIALLWVTGMRGCEVVALDFDDVDWGERLLVVRESKFGKSRELVLHDSTLQALRDYLARRRRLCPQPKTPALFLSATRGMRMSDITLRAGFHQLTKIVGLKPRSALCRPRMHDVRHSFAVRTLLDWYRDGGDVQARLPLLSTYLGHADPAATYWYLSAAPELLALAGQRLQHHLEETP
jgi:integrase